jgi:chemotaxis protein methyltransferase CheR
MPEAEGRDQQHLLWSRLSEVLSARMGLHYPPTRSQALERGIAAAASAFGHESAAACARWLLSAPLTRNQIEILAGCLTIGETYFFRDRRSFEILEQEVLPELVRTRSQAGERRLRIWSAGCATGEEAYSIAMLLARAVPDLADWNISILATDIDSEYLRKASRGAYSEWSFRDMPPGMKERFFRKTKDKRFEIAPHIKSLVSFGYLNLADDDYPSLASGTHAMDVVFCRNVLMYFGAEAARRVVEKLANALLDGGWLFVSPVEIPQAALPQLQRIEFPGAIIHRKARATTSYATPTASTPRFDEGLSSASQPEPWRPEAFASATVPVRAGDAPASSAADAAVPFEQGRHTDAAARLDEISPNAGDAATMALAARACANQGRLSEALEWCDKALAADKLNAGWSYLRAAILQEQGLADDAIVALRRALYLDQEYALAHFALGNLLGRQGRQRDAERHFRNALSILSACPQETVLTEAEGITAGTLAELIREVSAPGGTVA